MNPRDIDFLLYECLDVAELCDRPRYREHSIESFDSVPDLAAEIAINRFAPHFKTAGDFYEGKRIAVRYIFHYELPKTTAQFDFLDGGDRTTVDLDENWF